MGTHQTRDDRCGTKNKIAPTFQKVFFSYFHQTHFTKPLNSKTHILNRETSAIIEVIKAGSEKTQFQFYENFREEFVSLVDSKLSAQYGGQARADKFSR